MFAIVAIYKRSKNNTPIGYYNDNQTNAEKLATIMNKELIKLKDFHKIQTDILQQNAPTIYRIHPVFILDCSVVKYKTIKLIGEHVPMT